MDFVANADWHILQVLRSGSMQHDAGDTEEATYVTSGSIDEWQQYFGAASVRSFQAA